jgi:hypothetical protein
MKHFRKSITRTYEYIKNDSRCNYTGAKASDWSRNNYRQTVGTCTWTSYWEKLYDSSASVQAKQQRLPGHDGIWDGIENRKFFYRGFPRTSRLTSIRVFCYYVDCINNYLMLFLFFDRWEADVQCVQRMSSFYRKRVRDRRRTQCRVSTLRSALGEFYFGAYILQKKKKKKYTNFNLTQTPLLARFFLRTRRFADLWSLHRSDQWRNQGG